MTSIDDDVGCDHDSGHSKPSNVVRAALRAPKQSTHEDYPPEYEEMLPYEISGPSIEVTESLPVHISTHGSLHQTVHRMHVALSILHLLKHLRIM